MIAAVEGFCTTGGCELALACVLRIAGGTQRLPRIVGIANALPMLFSADPIDADEALRIGLINRKTERGAALAAALELGAIFAERAPVSRAFTKRTVRRGIELDLPAAIALETEFVSRIYATNDKEEGISAFLGKRPPKFRGC